MINLLPPKEQAQLRLITTERMIAILGIISVALLVCFTLIFFLLKLYMLQEANTQLNVFMSSQQRYRESDDASYEQLAQTYNTLLAKADAFYQGQVSLSDAMMTISQVARPKYVVFTTITLTREAKGGVVDVAASGKSATRDDLLSFKSALEGNGQIKNVQFPPESWVNPDHIIFNVTFQVIPKNGSSQ